MLKTLWKNLKTTLAGAVAGGALIVNGCAVKDVSQIITGIAISLLGLLSKDAKKEPPAADPAPGK